jgi:outer membrane receptor protein involved in Fe transport
VASLLIWCAPLPAAAQDPAPPAGRGAVVGSVVEAANARPIVGALVQVIGDSERRERTGPGGHYRLYLPPGSYRLRISAADFTEKTLENVTVTEGRSTVADANLAAAPRAGRRTGVEVIDVTADVTESTEATQLLKRKMAPTVSDSLGAESIGKTPDSDAAEVVTRVPAVTVKDDKFIIVRGLGERYSSALLNGSRLPSTDPNRRIVPLDIFPADFIESLNIIKTYTPDLPGDFSGGLVDIRLAEPPAQLTYGLSTSLSFNTETTFQDFDTYDGYTADWFTLGDGPRALPSTFDIFPDSPNSTFSPSTTQMRALVGSLPLNWNIDSTTAPPNFSVDGFVGNTWGPFGINLAASYGWDFGVHRDEVNNSFSSKERLDANIGQIFLYDTSSFETQLGAVLTTQYEINREHKLLGRALVNRQSIDEVQLGTGQDTNNQFGVIQDVSSSQYTANQLGFGALEGLHHFPWMDLDWRGSWAPSSQSIPDAKFYVYASSGGAPPALQFDNSNILEPQRTWTDLSEFLQDYNIDGTIPFRTRLPFTDVWRGLRGQIKTGLAYLVRDRSFLYQDFRIAAAGPAGRIDLTAPPDSVFIPPNFAARPLGPLTFNRLNYEPFDASQEVAGFYGMADLPLIEDRLRLIGGARLEYSYIETDGFQRGVGSIGSIINDLDPLPGASLIYTLRDDMNIRAAFSQTVSRPEFRELTPIIFTTLPGQRGLVGNNDLVTTNITNYDLRWEWFFSPLELASLSFFYKDLEQPIELVTGADAGGTIYDVFVNYDSATLWGVEMEVRKDFNFAVPYARRVTWLRTVAPHLADLQVLINVSVVDSETSETFTPPDFPSVAPAPGNPPLQGQSPYVINASLEYEDYRWGLFRLLYNTVGPTIVAKGTKFGPSEALPDIESQRRDQLDFVWLSEVTLFDVPFSTKFAVQNILNDRFLETQGERITNRYRTGVTFSTGITYSF